MDKVRFLIEAIIKRADGKSTDKSAVLFFAKAALIAIDEYEKDVKNVKFQNNSADLVVNWIS